jgi:hypothetical protein
VSLEFPFSPILFLRARLLGLQKSVYLLSLSSDKNIFFMPMVRRLVDSAE